MKLGIFTDPHYSSHEVTCYNRYNNQSLRKIKEAYAHFAAQNCDLIVCLGDLIDTESDIELTKKHLSEISEVIHSVSIPSVCLLGNHDAYSFEIADFYSILGIDAPHDMEIDGKRLIFLDACFFKDGRHYGPGLCDWTDTFLPDEDELYRKLDGEAHDTYLFMHQNIDPAVEYRHILYNAESIRKNIASRGNVKTVFQGHYHPGMRSEYDGIPYITLPAMCESEGAYFIFDI